MAARQEMVTTCTRQINRRRALLLTGEDSDRHAIRTDLTDAALSTSQRSKPANTIARSRSVRSAAVNASLRRISPHFADESEAAN